MAEFNLDNIATDLNDKIGKSECVRYPVSKWQSSDGLSWYTVYNDGWKECGGYITNNASGSMTISLPVEFTNSNYILNITNQRTSTSTTSTAIKELGWVSKTTSSFTKYLSTNKNYDVGFDYYTCGY